MGLKKRPLRTHRDENNSEGNSSSTQGQDMSNSMRNHKASQLPFTMHVSAHVHKPQRMDTPRPRGPRPLSSTSKSLRELSKNTTPIQSTKHHLIRSLAPARPASKPRNTLVTPGPIQKVHSRVPQAQDEPSPALFVFTSGSEDELVQDNGPRKPRPRPKPKRKIQELPQAKQRLAFPLPSTSASISNVNVRPATTSAGAATGSFWKRASFASISKGSGSRRKRKIGGNEDIENKKRKYDLSGRTRNDSSSIMPSIVDSVDSSEDEDDVRFRSIFKEPFSWKPKNSVLNLSLNFISKASTTAPTPTPVKRYTQVPQKPQTLLPQENEIDKSKKQVETTTTSTTHTKTKMVKKVLFGAFGKQIKEKSTRNEFDDDEEPLVVDLIDEVDENYDYDGEPVVVPTSNAPSTSASALAAIEKNKKRVEVKTKSPTKSASVALENKTDFAIPRPRSTEVKSRNTKLRKIETGKEKEKMNRSTSEAEALNKINKMQMQRKSPEKFVNVTKKTITKMTKFPGCINEIAEVERDKNVVEVGLAKELPLPALASTVSTIEETAAQLPLPEIKEQRSQETQTHIEVNHQACATEPRLESTDKGTETDRVVTMDEGTNTVQLKYRDRGVDPIVRTTTRDAPCIADMPVGKYKSTQTDPEPNWQFREATSNGYFTMNGSSFATRVRDFNHYGRERSQSPVPSLHGTELHENGGANRLLVDERIDEDVVYAQVDEDLPAFRNLANSELQSEEMMLSVSEARNSHIYTTSLRDVREDGWDLVYPNVRMCIFNPCNGPGTPEFNRHMIGYIVMEPKTIRPYEESEETGQIMYTCIQGSVVIKANQFTTNTEGTQTLTPIPLQAGGCILMGSRAPHLIENRTNQEAKLAFLMIQT